jgi:hypothetical protein
MERKFNVVGTRLPMTDAAIKVKGKPRDFRE